MKTLLDNIISLEREADGIIEKARASAKEIKSSTEEALRKYKEDLAKEREERIEKKEKEAQLQYEETIATEELIFEKNMKAIKNIPDEKLEREVERILSRFREL